jgi:hypothetical protein
LLEPAYDCRVAALAVRAAAMAVMGIRVPVEADAYLNVKLVEKLQVSGIEKYAVSLQTERDVNGGVKRPPDFLYNITNEVWPGQ